MKTFLLAACVAFIAVSGSSQSNQSQPSDNDLYSLALKTSILQMEKEWGQIDDSVMGEQIRTDYRHMIVQKDPLIINELLTQFDNHVIEYLDSDGLMQRYRKLGKSYSILVIRPMHNEGQTLKVAVIVYWFSSSKKNRLQFALSDWSNVEFHYDCDKQQFVVSSVKLGGI
jgi:hypothetical protein